MMLLVRTLLAGSNAEPVLIMWATVSLQVPRPLLVLKLALPLFGPMTISRQPLRASVLVDKLEIVPGPVAMPYNQNVTSAFVLKLRPSPCCHAGCPAARLRK